MRVNVYLDKPVQQVIVDDNPAYGDPSSFNTIPVTANPAYEHVRPGHVARTPHYENISSIT